MSTLAPIGVQLYSLREEINDDLPGVLEKLAEIGYAGVEPFGGIDYEQAAPVIERLGLDVPSMHTNLPLGDDQNRVLDMAAAYDLKSIIAPMRPPDDFKSAGGIKRTCELLNQAAAVAADNGYRFGYHNHWWEYQKVDGRLGYQIMLEHLDPSIFLEVDTYWVKTAGVDPTQIVRELGDRAPLLHIKDGPAFRDEPMVAVGDGTLDIPGIVQAGSDSTEWLIVELDRCATDMMQAVEKSLRYLLKEGLGRGRNN